MTGRILAKTKNVKNDVCRISYLLSNGFSEKIVVCDLDLPFECPKFATLISLKWLELSQKMNGTTFENYNIYDQRTTLRKMYSETLTYFLKVKNIKM